MFIIQILVESSLIALVCVKRRASIALTVDHIAPDLVKNAGEADSNGKIVIPAKYDGVGGFTEGLAAVQLGGKWGYIDENDNVVMNWLKTGSLSSAMVTAHFKQRTNYFL